MDLIHATSALPEAVLLPLAIWFFAGAGFYLYRGLFPEHVKAVYGYSDLENEIGHGLCALAMVPMLAPMLLPIPSVVWTALLGVGFVWYTARAFTWGKRVTYATAWWWDWAHVGMLGGMAIMYAGVNWLPLSIALAVFWLWLACYYLYEFAHDLKSRNAFYIGSDLVHASMGAVMFAMTIAPSLFMGGMSMYFHFERGSPPHSLETNMSNSNNGAPLQLRPRKSSLVETLLSKRSFLRDLTLACGSPLNVLLPERVSTNVEAFKSVLEAHSVPGRVFFAHKCNQSASLIRQLATQDVSADVASLEELRHALGAGFSSNRIEATGPKSPEFIALCLQHNVVLNVDSLQELQDIEKIAECLALDTRPRVLLRFSGFSAAHTPVLQKQSRFGIPFADRDTALNMVAGSSWVELLGFSFHLDTVSIDERVVAIENCLTAFEESVGLGMEPRVIDIGGGFKVSYLESADDWQAYTTAIKQAALGSGQSLTWQNNFFGLAAEQGVLRGKLNSYEYFEPRPGALFLDDILNAELPSLGDRRVADVLRDNMIELWLEPGRALLDQCGITLARVNSIKKSSSGDTLVGLNMKRQDLSFLDQEVFVDPIVLTANTPTDAPQAVFFTGNLCLEGDLIFRHKVSLPAVPKVGDLVAFINTAAYMMDFSATRSIMQPPARRVAVVRDKKRFAWMLDEQYTPIWRLTR